MIRRISRIGGKVSLVFVLLLTTLWTGTSTVRPAQASGYYPFVGEIHLFPYDKVPKGWLFAGGQELKIEEYRVLFDEIGNSYGGDVYTTFALPNLTSVPVPDGVAYYIATQGIRPNRDGLNEVHSFTGEVRLLPYSYVPGGWVALRGQRLLKRWNTELLKVLPADVIQDETTFTLPKLESPLPGTPLTYAISSTESGAQNGTTIDSWRDEDLIGELLAFAVPMNTPGYPADGRRVPVQTNQALASLFGSHHFGGDGVSEIGMPDLSNNPQGLYYYVVNQGEYPGGLEDEWFPIMEGIDGGSHSTVQDQKIQLDVSVLMGRYYQYMYKVSWRTQPEHGSVKVVGSGIEYTPAPGFSGTDSFTFRIYNVNGFAKEFGTAKITVTPGSPPSVSGVTNETVYASAVTPTFAEGTATLNGAAFTSGTTVNAEGSYTLEVTNRYGTTTVRFAIDLSAPVIGGVTEGGRYSEPPTLTFDEGTALLNGQAVSSGTKITNEGDYTLVVTNAANQTSTVHFRYYALRQLSFDSAGGTDVTAQSLHRGDLGSRPAPPTRTGYTFTGWYKDLAHTQPFDFANTPILADTLLYAGWEQQAYPVHFDSDGGTSIPNQSIAYGSTISEPQPPSKTGYRFEGWYADAARTQKFNFASTVHEAVTLYAGWKAERYTVEFDSVGGTPIADQVLDYGSFAAAPPAPERTGYTFGGWYKDANLSERYLFDSSAIRGDLTLYASWDRIMRTVSFQTHGGSSVDQASVGYGDSLTAPPDPTPGQEGLRFAGWFADEAYTQPFDFSVPIVTDTELHAKWAQRVQRIVFDSTGGSAVSEQQAAYGDLLSRPADPTRVGYDFAGWYSDASHQQPFDFASEAVTADLTLYADWTPAIYRIEFDTAGGSEIAEQQVAHGDLLTRPADPVRTGYTFEGWYQDRDYRQPVDFASATALGDLKLYAKWTPVLYRIEFDTAGGSKIAEQQVAYGDLPTRPASPTRIGYAFEDWYADGAYREAFDFASSAVTANLRLYAKWAPILYRLAFDAMGGSTVAEQQANYGQAWIAPDDPTRTGYTFDGWYTDAERTQRFVFEKSSATSDLRLYAGWTPVSPPNPTNPTNPTNPSGPSTPSDPNSPSNPATPGGTSPANPATPSGGPAPAAGTPASGGQSTANSAEGRLVLPARQSGEVRLGSELLLQIPSGTVQQPTEIQASVRTAPIEVSEPNLRLVSSVYELKKNTSQAFERPLTLTLRFDASSLKPGETAAIFYQNEAGGPWTRVEGGVQSGNEIRAEIQHFTLFAVMAVQDSNASAASAGKARFADIDRHWAAADIRRAAESGIVTGYADGSFKPNARITRAEFAVMLLRALAPRPSDSNVEEISLPFTDGDSIGAWAKADIARAYALGWVKGNGSGKFRPDAFINRAEMAVMIAEAASLQGSGESPSSFADTAAMPAWAASSAAAVRQAGLMNGRSGNRFEPLASATRAEAASVLLRVLSN